MASLQSTSVNGTLSATGAVTLSNYGAGFVKLNASGAIVIDTNSYLTSGSFLPLAGGTMTGILYVETTSDPNDPNECPSCTIHKRFVFFSEISKLGILPLFKSVGTKISTNTSFNENKSLVDFS